MRFLVKKILEMKLFGITIINIHLEKKHFPRASETIIFYSKSNNSYFNPLREERDKPSKQLLRVNIKGVLKNKKDDSGKCIYRIVTDKKMDNVWRIPCLQPASKEMIGYVTQKPKALIRRILECSTKDNDIVLDFFGGGGTTAEVCHDLNRRFTTGDISPVAYRVMRERL